MSAARFSCLLALLATTASRSKDPHPDHRRPLRRPAQALPRRDRPARQRRPRHPHHARVDPRQPRPTGPVDEITGVVFTANGKTFPGVATTIDLYQFHLTIPAGVTTLHAHLDCIVTARVTHEDGRPRVGKAPPLPRHIPSKTSPSSPPSSSPPAGASAPHSRPPTATTRSTPSGGTTHYAATTVEQLEDSPVITGHYFHEFPLAPEVTPKHYIDVVSDSPEDSNLRPSSSPSSPTSSARPAPPTPRATTTSTTSSSPSPTSPAAKASSTASPPTTA